MSATSDTRRLLRNFAAVEARYVRDLGRRERGGSRATPRDAGRGHRAPTERRTPEHARLKIRGRA